jgi:hypothetical protein
MMHGLLNDGHNGTLSSKRVVTFLAFLLCAVAFIANLFWGFEVKQFMYDSMIYLTMVGLGVTAAEKFAPINKETKKGLL